MHVGYLVHHEIAVAHATNSLLSLFRRLNINHLLMNGAGPTRRNAKAINMLPTMETDVGYLIRSQIWSKSTYLFLSRLYTLFSISQGHHPEKKATVVTYFIYRLVLPVVVFCNGPFPFSFSLFSLFQQLTCFADDWYRTAFLRYQKLLFCQLSHNNCRTH